MNPLTRFFAMALFVVLAVLTALVAAPRWRHQLTAPSTPAVTAVPAPAASVGAARAARMAEYSERAVLALAVLGLVLAGALLFSLALRPAPRATRPPFATARHEIGTLTKLAAASAAQEVELGRERDVRRRAEEDGRLKQDLLAQSLEEKIRLGQDLHDGIIQSLYAVGLTLESVRPLLRSDAAEAERRVGEVRDRLNSAIRDVRAYIIGLAPDNLRRASFGRGVVALFEQLRAGRAAQIEVKVDEDAAEQLTEEQNLEALQIAREAISNALRHGEASQVTLRMHTGDGEVCLLVQDNGRGFDAQQRRDGGHGLGNMRTRAERLGATFRIASAPGEGTRVIANFPIARTT